VVLSLRPPAGRRRSAALFTQFVKSWSARAATNSWKQRLAAKATTHRRVARKPGTRKGVYWTNTRTRAVCWRHTDIRQYAPYPGPRRNMRLLVQISSVTVKALIKTLWVCLSPINTTHHFESPVSRRCGN
jgi:hypothetical protein